MLLWLKSKKMKNITLKGIGEYLKLLGILGIVITFTVGILWKVYAEPRNQTQIDSTLAPVLVNIGKIKDKAKKQDKKIEDLSFESKQQLFLLKTIAGEKAVSKMEEVTEIFKPDDYEEK